MQAKKPEGTEDLFGARMRAWQAMQATAADVFGRAAILKRLKLTQGGAMQAKKPEGTEDLFGARMRAWQAMQATAADVFGRYGFSAIETPAMEQVDVFVHGIGQSTDVVRKEMFRVFSGQNFANVLEAGTDAKLKPGKRLALRPEGTAGFVRAAVENTFVPQGGAPVKMWYAGPMFRGERVQKGRLRQFHQVGAEVLGAPDPALDAEVIIMLMDFYEELGLDRSKMRLLINSMGDPACRPAYRDAVATFIREHADEMCEECLVRADTNPLRAFDCKNDACRAVMADAPLITDALCDECAEHYAKVKQYLDEAGIAYEEDPTLVRGLDYYTRTVFEVQVTELCDECAEHYAKVKQYLDEAGIAYEEDPTLVRGLDYYTRTVFEVQVTEGMGAQSAIGGGGRYDGLMELEGGKPTPGIGFAVGFERIMLALEAQGVNLAGPEPTCVYVVSAAPECRDAVFRACLGLRRAGVTAEADYQGRSMKSQMKQADKHHARLCVIIGPDELAAGEATVRDMRTHEQRSVPQGRSMKSQMKQADKHHARLCVIIGPDELAAGEATVRDMRTHEQRSVPLENLACDVRDLVNDDAFAQADFPA